MRGGAFHAAPRDTFLIYSENTMPGLQALFEQLIPAMYHNNLAAIPPGMVMPPGFKNALLTQLNLDPTDNVVYEGEVSFNTCT